jgi:hypothetical protein
MTDNLTRTTPPLFVVEVWDDDAKELQRLNTDFYDRETADACKKTYIGRGARVMPYYPPIVRGE